MSLKSLFNQTITIYVKNGYDEYGAPTFTTGTSTKARFQKVTKQRFLPNNTVIVIEAIAYVDSDISVGSGDKVVYGSDNYKVHTLSGAVDGNGKISHYKLELTKWQI